MKMKREDVYLAIDSERNYQEQIWDDTTTKASTFILCMEEYLAKARAIAAKTNENDPVAVEKIMAEIRKVVALGVGAGEYHGMPAREIKDKGRD